MSISSPKEEHVSPDNLDSTLEEPGATDVIEEEADQVEEEPQTPVVEEASKPDPMIKTKKICGVCDDKPSRYKCSRCYLP
jgi:hypothetical protein